VEENMEIYTNTSKVREARKTVIGLLLSEHNNDCPIVIKMEIANFRLLPRLSG